MSKLARITEATLTQVFKVPAKHSLVPVVEAWIVSWRSASANVRRLTSNHAAHHDDRGGIRLRHYTCITRRAKRSHSVLRILLVQ